MKSIKNILSKFVNDIFSNIYRSFLRIIGWFVVIVVISFAASRCAKAMTINDNLRTISETQRSMFENIYMRSDYDYYLLSSSYNNSGYNNYIDYYLCLTNDKIDTSSVKNVTSECEELYRYNNYSNNYVLEKLSDTELKVVNSVYYSSSIMDKQVGFNTIVLLIVISILVSLIFFFYMVSVVFRL